MQKSSPEYLRLSLAAVMTLGLKKGRFYREAKLYCLNLLLTYPDGCRAACTYCGLARPAEVETNNSPSTSFIRVEWPAYATDLIIERANECSSLERACISTLTHPNNRKDTHSVLKKLRKKIDLPISILSNPTTTTTDEMKALHDAGADRFTIAIDLATEDLFEKHRGETVKGPHRWNRYWKALTEAKDIFGKGNIGAHLISGMGETEQEMAGAIQLVSDMGGTTHLFSFYPEKGSKLENKKPCGPGQYRKVQMARYLIDKGMSKYEKMMFDSEGRIMDYGVAKTQEESIIDSGKPFETCGCPGKGDRETACNRPYGDGPPSDIKSYPFPLESRDIKKVRMQMNGRILPEKVSRIEQLHGADIDTGIWQMALDARPENRKRIRLHLPSFRRHSTSELSNSCANKSFPAFSLTGNKCALMCDHCQGKILDSMTPTLTPLDLLEAAKKAAEQKAEGILLSGGSDINGSVLFQPFIETISEIRKKYGLSIAVHTGLIDKKTADSLSSAGVETVMIDIIGSNKTIRNVYKLNKSVEDYEESLKVLCGTSMKIVPHIVFGLHYGKIRGEYNAMEIISRHKTTAIVVVAVVPYYAKNPAMFPPPTSDDLGSFIAKCRKKLPDRELILGCARPGGVHRQQTDLYALAAGIDSIAFPADGTLAAAKELGYKTEVAYSCCSMAALPKETMQENGETP